MASTADAAAKPAVFTIILFYKYTRVAVPKETLAWQEAICKRMGLQGRIRIATEGINGTLAGSAEGIAGYIADMNDESQPHGGIFAGIEYKYSTDPQQPFPALGMFEVKELTASGAMAKSCKLLLERGEPVLTKVDPSDAAAASSSPVEASPPADMHLSPSEFHAALENFNPETDLLLDTRNAYETAIGMFEHAVDPKLRAFAQLPEYVTQNLDAIKSKKRILMYCTGGIRCEKASLYMAHRTGAQVQQLRGGIHRYLDEYPDGGLFRGKNMVFDGRLAMASTDPTVIGKCVQCATSADKLSEAVLCRVCKMFVILCPACLTNYEERGWQYYCSEHMLLAAGKDYDPATTAAAAAAPSSVPAAASSSPPAPATPAVADTTTESADGDDTAPPRPEDSWSPPSSDPGCPEQLAAFLSRFTDAQLEAQLDEMSRILVFFRTKQKKAGSRSANRKANLYTQVRRLEDHLTDRRRAEALAKGEVFVEPVRVVENKSQKQPRGRPAAAAAQAEPQAPTASPPQLLSFVPFLNM